MDKPNEKWSAIYVAIGSLILFSAWIAEKYTLYNIENKKQRFDWVKSHALLKTSGAELNKLFYSIYYINYIKDSNNEKINEIGQGMLLNEFKYRNYLRQDIDEMLFLTENCKYDSNWKYDDLQKMYKADYLMNIIKKEKTFNLLESLSPEFIYSYKESDSLSGIAIQYRYSLIGKEEYARNIFYILYLLGSCFLSAAFIIKNNWFKKIAINRN